MPRPQGPGSGHFWEDQPVPFQGAGMEPIVAHALSRAGAEIGRWRRTSAAMVLDEASRRLDRTPDELIDSASRSPESAQLLAETMLAAPHTMNEQKIHALARALGNGLRDDDARPDEEQLLVAALAEVEAPHIKALTHLGPERTRTRTSATNLRSRIAPTSRGHRPAYPVGPRARRNGCCGRRLGNRPRRQARHRARPAAGPGAHDRRLRPAVTSR